MHILAVSKPIAPPWTDASKNLVRDIALGTRDAQFTLMTDGEISFGLAHIRELPAFRRDGPLAGAVSAGHLARAVASRSAYDVRHFFFTPNARTSTLLGALALAGSGPTVQTLCSIPRDLSRVRSHLFCDVHIALSRYTQERLISLGVPDVAHIPPAIPPIEPVPFEARSPLLRQDFGLDPDRPVVLFPGDYSFGGAAETVADAALRLGPDGPATWVFACRPKRHECARVERAIRQRLAGLGDSRVRFFGTVPRIRDLIAASDVVVMPAASTFAKMDLPLVLLESMALGRPVIVSDRPPLVEVVANGGGISLQVNSGEVLADTVADLLDSPTDLARHGAQAVQAARRFRRERVAAQHVALYGEFCA